MRHAERHRHHPGTALAGVVLVLVGMLMTATAPSAPAASRTSSPTATPGPTTELVWSLVTPGPSSEDPGTFRWVARVSNPADRTRIGVWTKVTAYDAAGAEVAWLIFDQPPIPAGGTIDWVGSVTGSYYLDGPPTTLAVSIHKRGGLAARAADPWATDAVTLAPAGTDEWGNEQYRVTAEVTTGKRASPDTVACATVVLRNADGAVVGSDVVQLTRWAKTIPPQRRFRVEFPGISATEVPVTAEVVGVPASWYVTPRWEP